MMPFEARLRTATDLHSREVRWVVGMERGWGLRWNISPNTPLHVPVVCNEIVPYRGAYETSVGDIQYPAVLRRTQHAKWLDACFITYQTTATYGRWVV